MAHVEEQGQQPPTAKGYGQYCPITRAVEVLGERWSLLIVRDMLIGATRFNDVARGNPGLSRSLLSKRLRQLERAGIVEHVDDRWLLTPAGRDLQGLVFGLGEWGARWQFDDPREDELHPDLLMWWVHDRLDYAALTDRRVVIEFRFSDHRDRFWIMHDAQGPSVCKFDPGFGVDATGSLRPPHDVHRCGRASGTCSRRCAPGDVEIDGSPAVAKRLPLALQLSPMAPYVVAANEG